MKMELEMERLRRSVCWEVAGQSVKLGFASCAVILLLVINSNVHHLVSCLSGSTTATNSLILPTPNVDCYDKSFGDTVSLHMSCCNSSFVSFTAVNSDFIDYNGHDAHKFVS